MPPLPSSISASDPFQPSASSVKSGSSAHSDVLHGSLPVPIIKLCGAETIYIARRPRFETAQTIIEMKSSMY